MKAYLVSAMLAGVVLVSPLAADESGKPELPADLAAVPGEAFGFIHIHVADIWKSDALKEMRETVLKAGEKALQGFDNRFVPTPSSIDRLTVVLMPRDGDIRQEPTVLAILRVNKPFNKEEVLKSTMPEGVEKKTTNGSYWVDGKTEFAVSFIKDQVIVVGPIVAMENFIDKRSAGTGDLTEALRAANSKHHVTIAGNLGLIPMKAHQEVPPPFRPLLQAKTALLTFDAAENAVLDLSLNFKDERAAMAGLTSLEDLAKLGRDFIKKGREEMLNTVLGDGKTAPLDKLPESAMALVALGGMERLDGFLAEPPLKRDRNVVKLSLQVPNMSYTAMMPVAVGLLLPAVQKVREAAARAQSQNNLKQIAIAMHNYHDQMGTFPPAAICDKNGKPLLSWRVALLPYIEQQNLYTQFKLDEPWDSEHNKPLSKMVVKIYSHPLAANPSSGLSNYRVFYGNGAMFELNKGMTLGQIADGTSNTLMVVEADEGVPWSKPDDFAYDPKKPLPKFANFTKTGFNAAFADGSVRFLANSIPEATLRALITANGGEVVNLP